MESLPAAGLQLAHIPVGLPVAAAHLGAELAPANALGQPFPGRVFALQPVPARQVVFAPARFTFSLRAHQAAVAAVRHVAAGAAGARTGAHVAPCGTLKLRLRGENVRQVKKERSAEEEIHGCSRSHHSHSRCAHLSEDRLDKSKRWRGERHESLDGRRTPKSVRPDVGVKQLRRGPAFHSWVYRGKRQEEERGGESGRGGAAWSLLWP